MNPGTANEDASIHYYDSDYPSPFDKRFPENFDRITEYQGLAFDLDRYLMLVRESGGPVLEMCCGTGRVAIPLAREGFEITAVDINEAMLRRFRCSLDQENADVARRVHLIQQDVSTLDLHGSLFQTEILAFNSLLCIPDFIGQCKVLESAARHLEPGGRLLIDIVNPVRLPLNGDPAPKPFFTRKDRDTGNTYTRFAMMGPLETDQKQRLQGWYDEITPDGTVKRSPYSLYWRPIFRYEIQLMLERAGLRILKIEGGHRQEAFTAESPRMFIQAGRA